MREFLAAALTVIAMGVLLIAYTLSGSRVAAAPGAGLVQYDGYQFARPAAAAERVDWTGDPYAVRTPNGYPTSAIRPVGGDPYTQTAPGVRRVSTSTAR